MDFPPLKKIGLSDKEERIYYTLLQSGPLLVTELARKTSINRTTSYFVLASLQKKGFVSMTRKQQRTFYAAEDPAIISQYVGSILKEWQESFANINRAIPELRAIHQQPINKPRVRYYEGVEGLKAIYEESLTCRERHIRAYASVEHLKDVLGTYAEEYFRRRTERGIKIRSIIPTSNYGLHLKKIQENFLREIHLIDSKRFSITPEIYIYDDKVAYISLQEKFGVVVESKEIAEAEKKIYELAWELTRSYNKKEEKKLKKQPI